MTRHDTLLAWIEEIRALCQPDSVRMCDGSQAEYDEMCELLVQKGTFRRLNPDKRPNSFLAWSDPNDVARVEDRTFICSRRKDDAGPTNNWMDPREMKTTLKGLFAGCMKGRVMYVVPFCMGPPRSPLSVICIELTASPYVVLSIPLITCRGKTFLYQLCEVFIFVPAVLSVGTPPAPGLVAEPSLCSRTA